MKLGGNPVIFSGLALYCQGVWAHRPRAQPSHHATQAYQAYQSHQTNKSHQAHVAYPDHLTEPDDGG